MGFVVALNAARCAVVSSGLTTAILNGFVL
jgi:hypothetical protein